MGDISSKLNLIRENWTLEIQPKGLSLRNKANATLQTIVRISSSILQPNSQVAIGGITYRLSKNDLLKAAAQVWSSIFPQSTFEATFPTPQAQLEFAQRLLNCIFQKPSVQVSREQITPTRSLLPESQSPASEVATAKFEAAKKAFQERYRELFRGDAIQKSKVVSRLSSIGGLLVDVSDDVLPGIPGLGVLFFGLRCPQLYKDIKGLLHDHPQEYKKAKEHLSSLQQQLNGPEVGTDPQRRLSLEKEIKETRAEMFRLRQCFCKDLDAANKLVNGLTTVLTTTSSSIGLVSSVAGTVGTTLETLGSVLNTLGAATQVLGIVAGVVATGVGAVGVGISIKGLVDIQHHVKDAEQKQKKSQTQAPSQTSTTPYTSLKELHTSKSTEQASTTTVQESPESKTIKTCETLVKHADSKKVQFWKEERGRQILKIAKFAVVTLVGLLTIALSVLLTIATAGIAPAVIGLLAAILVLLIGSGITFAAIKSRLKAQVKKAEEEFLPQDLRRAGIKGIEDMEKLAADIQKLSLPQKMELLRYLGFGMSEEELGQSPSLKQQNDQNLQALAENTEYLTKALMLRFADVFPKNSASVMLNQLRELGIRCETPLQTARAIVDSPVFKGDPAVLALFLFKNGVSADLAECQRLANGCQPNNPTREGALSDLSRALGRNRLSLFREHGRELFEEKGLRHIKPEVAVQKILGTNPKQENLKLWREEMSRLLIDTGICVDQIGANALLYNETLLKKQLCSARIAPLFD